MLVTFPRYGKHWSLWVKVWKSVHIWVWCCNKQDDSYMYIMWWVTTTMTMTMTMTMKIFYFTIFLLQKKTLYSDYIHMLWWTIMWQVAIFTCCGELSCDKWLYSHDVVNYHVTSSYIHLLWWTIYIFPPTVWQLMVLLVLV